MALMQLVDVAAAMSIQALRGTDQVFLAEIHALRPHAGQMVQRGEPARALGRLGHRQLAPR